MIQKELVLTIKNKLQQALPGEQSHCKMLPLERSIKMKYFPGNPSPVAGSVMILLFPLDNYLGTLLIKRTEDHGVHSGQIGFPGGKRDENDMSSVATALREAEEEIGVQTKNIEIIGSLSSLYISPSNFDITPIVGFCETLGTLKPNPAEVDHIIELSLNNLERSRTNVNITVRGFMLKQVPCFSVNGHIIWGATAMILQELMDVMNGN